MPCFLSIIQSPIQAFLRPAVWLPGINRLHSHREQWVAMSGTADQLIEELIQAVERAAEADPNTTYAVKQVDREKHKVQIYNWTRAEWLDVVEIEFRDGANGGVEAKCFSFSSGFLPTWVPLCFLFNMIFFFIPFYDNKFNETRLERLRVAMTTECRLVPKKSKEPDETTPIVSHESADPTQKERHASSSSDRDTKPAETRHTAVMATGQYQAEATPTNVISSPAVESNDIEPSVTIQEPTTASADTAGTEALATKTSSEPTPIATDAEPSPQASNTEVVNV